MAGAELNSKSNLRQRILAFVGALILVSLLGSTLSLYRIAEVSRLLDGINRVSVPLGRLFAQMQSDADVFQRELERGLGYSHWKDPHWRPRPVPRWIEDVLDSEVKRMTELVEIESEWAPADARQRWRDWASNTSTGLQNLKADAARLFAALEKRDEALASQIYPRWISSLEQWRRELKWGASEYDRAFRQTFSLAEQRVDELQTGLEVILGVIISLSLLLLWLGERALRPLAELTALAREITRRGFKREDKTLLPSVSLARNDEVSQLAREFHNMATAVLERERTIESQTHRLQEQNKLLREMGELNENVLASMESILLVSDLEGKITQCNPVAARWLESRAEAVIGSPLARWPRIRELLHGQSRDSVLAMKEATKLGPVKVDGRVFGGYLMPLRHENGDTRGIVVLASDMTEEVDLQDRLRRAENLAAVGRMSAQVAHEVRNPLHAIGLEAEVAAELAARTGNPSLKQSVQSILVAVDRLEKITENYLKLSRLSSGAKSEVDLGEVLESVLATYASACEAQGVQVDWSREPRSQLKIHADRDLLEQVLGNLLRNSLQALEGVERPRVKWALGSLETGRVWLSIEDNGPGVPADIRDKLFTPFVTTKAQGTGLGLSFVKKVLEDHGGTIQYVDGTARGARFEMMLPALPPVYVNPHRPDGKEDQIHA